MLETGKKLQMDKLNHKGNRLRRLDFINEPFDTVICLNADLPEHDVFSGLSHIKIIAADGAADKLIAKGILPDIIIGDLDSLNENFHDRFSLKVNSTLKSEIIGDSDQETNDFEKVLRYCVDNNLHDLLITGFHGGDLEHSLNNWSVLMRFAAQLNLCVLDKSRYCIPVYRSVTFDCHRNEIISLIPQPSVLISTKDLQWELDREELALGKREGARNKAMGEYVELNIHEGSLLLCIDERLPLKPRLGDIV